MVSYEVVLKIGTTVQSHYIRNNKSNGQKNIRCYPRCARSGHRVAGFCGSGISVFVQVSPTTELKSGTSSSTTAAVKRGHKVPTNDKTSLVEGEAAEKFNFDDLVIVAEFLMWDPEAGEVASMIKTGTFYEADPVLNLVKTRGNNLAPLFLANSAEDEESGSSSSMLPVKTEKSFIIDPTCWHYGWKSHKHSNATTHFLRVYAFQRIEKYLKCLAYDDTARFTISSSKRYQRRSDGNMADISGAPIAKRRKIASEKQQEKKQKKEVTSADTSDDEDRDDDEKTPSPPKKSGKTKKVVGKRKADGKRKK